MTQKRQALLVQRLVDEGINKQAEQIRLQVIRQMYAAILVTLKDKHNWMPHKLIKLMEETTEQFDCITDKYIKIEDFYKLLEELGIKIVG